MRLFATAFLAGTVLLQQAAELPDPRVAALAAALALASRLPRGAPARALLVAASALVAACAYAAWRAEARLADELPPGTIRATCRWFAENRAAACVRCPQVVTLSPTRSSKEAGRRRLPIMRS